jgi:hypothetical protein
MPLLEEARRIHMNEDMIIDLIKGKRDKESES